MSEKNLKTTFQKWMSRQKKSNGTPYKEGTINAYTNALKNATPKLNLKQVPQKDLFTITAFDEFNEIHKLIISAPNFQQVDLAAGNKGIPIP